MKVEFYSSLRNVVGEKVIEIGNEKPLTMRQLIELVVAQYPVLRDIFFDSQGKLYASLPLFVNGRNPRLPPFGLEAVLSSTDIISIFTPISSGRLNVDVLKKAQNSLEGSEG